MEKEIEQLRHENRMKELEFQRETETFKHKWKMERLRIKNAETKRNMERGHHYRLEEIEAKEQSIKQTRV